MELVRIYECLCDVTRLRILHLLTRGPLCVCHVQAILGHHQVKVSRHLAYLRTRGMVTCRGHRNWRIYSLPEKRSPELEANLRCLQDCAQSDAQFRRDAARLDRVLASLDEGSSSAIGTCCRPATQRTGRRKITS